MTKPRALKPYTRRSVLQPKAKRYDWLKIKKTFLSNPTMTLREVAKKHLVSPKTLINKARKEKWVALRDKIQQQAELRMTGEVEKKLAEVKDRHSTIGKMLQHEGVVAIKKGKKPRTAREALQFTSEGVRIERDAEGVEKQQPQVVAIVQQQKKIISEYQFEEGEIVEEVDK